MRSFVRRLLVLLLSAALVTGLTVRSAEAGTIEMAAAAIATDMPMHGKCDGCAGSDKAMAPAACSAYCAGLTALPAMMLAVLHPVADSTVTPAVELAATEHIAAPEPYPPRPTILG